MCKRTSAFFPSSVQLMLMAPHINSEIGEMTHRAHYASELVSLCSHEATEADLSQLSLNHSITFIYTAMCHLHSLKPALDPSCAFNAFVPCSRQLNMASTGGQVPSKENVLLMLGVNDPGKESLCISFLQTCTVLFGNCVLMLIW